MNITGLELKLPITGDSVDFAPYLTTGQSRMLQKILLNKGSFNTSTSKVENLPTEAFFDMQDEAAKLLIRKVVKADGTELPFSREWIDNLPSQDGALVYERVNEITQSSNLSSEAKKK